MKIKITVEKGGAYSVHVASLLYDLWDDYLFYRDQAEATSADEGLLVHKRYVRAAIHSFFGYFEGVLNEWMCNIDPTVDLEETSFAQKIGLIRRKIGKNRQVPYLDIQRARDIRNAIVHVKPTDNDIEVMEKLMDGQFFRDADGFTNWMTNAAHFLKMERHPDVPKILKDFDK